MNVTRYPHRLNVYPASIPRVDFGGARISLLKGSHQSYLTQVPTKVASDCAFIGISVQRYHIFVVIPITYCH